MNYKSYGDLASDIKKNISRIQGQGFDLVVGIPRSGMIPAYIIASLLNIDCTDKKSFLLNTPLQKGHTKKRFYEINTPFDAKKILIVDDSINTGQSLQKEIIELPQSKKKRITTIAIYSSIRKRKDVDLFFEYLPLPRAFEWNIFHHSVLRKASLDIDGVLCIDPTSEENDDGVKYKLFLKNAIPQIIPTEKIHSLVTNRLEKYRSETETWLNKFNIRYDNLIMLDLPSKEERIRLKIHARHKAEHYKKSDAQFFIESDPVQAKTIAKLSGKAVYCFENNELYNSSVNNILRNNPIELKKYLPKAIRKYLYSMYLHIKNV